MKKTLAWAWKHETLGFMLPLVWHRKDLGDRMVDAKVVRVLITEIKPRRRA